MTSYFHVFSFSYVYCCLLCKLNNSEFRFPKEKKIYDKVQTEISLKHKLIQIPEKIVKIKFKLKYSCNISYITLSSDSKKKNLNKVKLKSSCNISLLLILIPEKKKLVK